MKLKSVRIQNFRSFKDQTIELDDYTCFVGANGAGKSSVLMALNILFRENRAPGDLSTLEAEDFHHRNTDEPIRITATFCDLSVQAKKDFHHYVRQNQLVVITEARWNADSQNAPVSQKGARHVIDDFSPFFAAEADKALVSELRKMFNRIRESYPELSDAKTKQDMIDVLRSHEESHPQLCSLQESDHQFYGWSKGANKLEQYCQWIYVPAVKDASDEQDEQKHSALGSLLQRTTNSKKVFEDGLNKLRADANDEYQKLLDDQKEALKDTTHSIQKRLRAWSHQGANVDLRWHFDSRKSVVVAEPYARASVGEGKFLGELLRLGHGMQRSFIIALLQELALIDPENAPTLILGFEEPELYQHPPQARHLSSVIEQLTEGDTQILATTHSPYFITSTGFECVRLVRASENSAESKVHQLTLEQLSKRLAGALGAPPQNPTSLLATIDQIMLPSKNELYFSKIPILVEGPEDAALIAAQIRLLELDGKFRELGCHFIVCGGKTSLSRPLAVALGLGIPAFAVFDGDYGKPYQERDNRCLLRICDSNEAPTPDKTIWANNFVMWKTDIRTELIGELGEATWSDLLEKCRTHSGLQSVSPKNGLLLAACVETLWNKGTKIKCLEVVSRAILDWAEAHSAN